MKYADQITQKKESTEPYDLFFSLDCSDTERLHEFKKYFEEAKYKICVDHHLPIRDLVICNLSYRMLLLLVKYYFLCLTGKDFLCCAQDLYMGIVHDTGVFKHTNTTRKTMETAGALLEKGIHSEDIIDRTFYKKILCAESDTWKSTYGKYCTLTWKSNLFDYP